MCVRPVPKKREIRLWKGVENPEQFQEKEALVGTGPFQLVDYNKERVTYLYAAYEQYYQGKPRVNRLKHLVLPLAALTLVHLSGIYLLTRIASALRWRTAAGGRTV